MGNDEKYKLDVERCKQIGSLMGQRIREKGISIDNILRGYREKTGLAELTARGEVMSCFDEGPNPYRFSSESYPFYRFKRRSMQEHALNRFSLVLSLLELESDDEIVRLAREVNPEFEYPLDLSSAEFIGLTHRRRRKKPEEISKKRVMSLIYGLKPEQMGFLEMMAEEYTKINQKDRS